VENSTLWDNKTASKFSEISVSASAADKDFVAVNHDFMFMFKAYDTWV